MTARAATGATSDSTSGSRRRNDRSPTPPGASRVGESPATRRPANPGTRQRPTATTATTAAPPTAAPPTTAPPTTTPPTTTAPTTAAPTTRRARRHGAPPDPAGTPARRHAAPSPEQTARPDPSPAGDRRTSSHERPDPSPAGDRPSTPYEELGFNPNVLRAAVAILAVLVVLATAGGAAARSWLDAAVVRVPALDPQASAIRNPALQAGDENVLVLTTDFPITDFPTTDRPAAGIRPDPGTASVVVAHVPRDSDSVVALSLPADLEVNRPPCERWDPATTGYLDQTVPAEVRTTLLSAFEVGGPRCVTRVVQQVTGLAISRFAALDRAGVAAMARAVGVAPCPPGPRPTTDYARIERDHRQLRAVLSRTLSFSTLLAPPRLLDLGDALPGAALGEGVGRDRVLGISPALDTRAGDRVTFAAAPVADAPNGRGHSELREAESNALFKAVREDIALPAQPDPRTVDIAAPSPVGITVDVLNASGRDGLAKGVAERLGGFGFEVGEVGNARDAAEATVVTFSPDREAAAELLVTSLPGATPTPDPSATGVLEVVLGSGFDDLVVAPDGPVAAGPGVEPGCG
ncbi:MAG: LCP family protein [Pseudonocardia sp.]